MSPRNAGIAGSGSFLPGDPVDNATIEASIPELPMEVLESYLGIDTRHMVLDPRTCERTEKIGTVEMAVKASTAALEQAQLGPQEVDLIVTNTTTPENPLPPTSFLLQRALGISSARIFDLRGGCAASVQAMMLAKTFIESGIAENALLCGVECTSPIYYKHLKNTPDPTMDEMLNGVIFGDGAGALVLRSTNHGATHDRNKARIGYCSTHSSFPNEDIGFEVVNEVDERFPMKVNTRTRHFNKAIGRTLPTVMKAAFYELTDRTGHGVDDFDRIIIPQVNESLLKVAYPEVIDSFVYIFKKIGNIPAAAIYLAYDLALSPSLHANGSGTTRRDAIVAIETVSWTYAVAELISER